MSRNYHSSPQPAIDAGRQYYLITNVSSPTQYGGTDAEIDLHAESWRLPYSIEDSELTFDGKPLNLLYEENRFMAEHECHNPQYAYSWPQLSWEMEEKSRGRRRKRRTKEKNIY